MQNTREEISSHQELQSKQGFTKEELTDLEAINEAYLNRTFSEDIDLLEKMGGIEFIEKRLNTNLKNGLSENSQNFESRRQNQGEEHLQLENNLFTETLFGVLTDPGNMLMIAAEATALILEIFFRSKEGKINYMYATGILIGISIIFIISYLKKAQKRQEVRQRQVLLSYANQKLATVKRGGQLICLSVSQIVVGDVVKLQEGEGIPFNGIIISSQQLAIDESSRTKETDPRKKLPLNQCIQSRDINKNNQNSSPLPSAVVLSATRVLYGEGTVLVTGFDDPQIFQREGESSLQSKLNPFDSKLKFSLIFLLETAFIIYSIYYLIYNFLMGYQFGCIADILHFLVIIIAMGTLSPGIHLFATLSLANGVKQLLKNNNLVRKLESIEAAGRVNIICTDSTGILTTNKMTLVEWWNGSSSQFSRNNNIDLMKDQKMTESFFELFIQAAALSNNAILEPYEQGSQTELAILKVLQNSGINFEEIRSSSRILCQFPFNSIRKRRSTIAQINSLKTGTTNRIFVQGASEVLLNFCDQWKNKIDGTVHVIDEPTKSQILNAIEEMGNKGMRSVCLAYKDLPEINDTVLSSSNEEEIFNKDNKSLIFLGILGICDILREGVPESLQRIHQAGIQVKMITADNVTVAKSIAQEVGIISENDKLNPNTVMEGSSFSSLIGGIVCKEHRESICNCAKRLLTGSKDPRKFSIKNSDQFNIIYQNLKVLARARPQDKLALVIGLTERNNVVAVTGDCASDAPALYAADVGFGMGISGTEVAREASGILLLDDSFNSIFSSIIWGRNIYASIKKFLQFQIVCNAAALSMIILTLIWTIIFKKQIVFPTLILLTNLIVSSFGYLLFTEVPDSSSILQESNRKENIISSKMAKHITSSIIIQIAATILFVLIGHQWLPEFNASNDLELIYILNVFAFMQIINLFQSRCLSSETASILQNKVILLFALIIIFAQITISIIMGMSPQSWFVCICFSLLSLFGNVLEKIVPDILCCKKIDEEQAKRKGNKDD